MKKTFKIIISYLIINYQLSTINLAHAEITNNAAPTFATANGLELLIATLWKTAFSIAGVITLLYLVMGGITWVTAGGDKANSEKARSQITDAIIGLVIMALSFAIIKFIGFVLGIDILKPQFQNNITN